MLFNNLLSRVLTEVQYISYKSSISPHMVHSPISSSSTSLMMSTTTYPLHVYGSWNKL